MSRARKGWSAAIAGVLLLTACGSDDESTDATDAAVTTVAPASSEAADTTTAEAPTTDADTTEAPASSEGADTTTAETEASDDSVAAPSGDPVQVMLVYDDTGPGAAPELVDGASAGVATVNAAGGVQGRPLELVPCATANDPNKADECARQAVAEGMVAVVGELTLQKGHEKILSDNNIPIIGAVLSGTDFAEPAQFPLIGSTAINIPILAQALAEGGATKISFARIQVDGGEALPGFANTGLEGRGLEIFNDVPVPGGAPDMAPYVEAALADGTDGLIIALPGADATAFLKQLKSVAPDLPVGLLGTQREKVFDALGADSDGILEGLFFLPPSYGNEATRGYEQAMADAGFTETRGYRMNAYAAVLAFDAAAENLDEITSAALWEYLPTVTDLETGLTTPIQWTTGGVAGLDRVFSSCALVTEVVDGQPVAVYDSFRDAFTFEDCPTPPKD